MNIVNQYRRVNLAYSIDTAEDNIINARVEGDAVSVGTYALEVRGKIFGNDWRSNEYEQFAIVDNNASGDTAFNGELIEGEDSVEMNTALVILPPTAELTQLINDANTAIETAKQTDAMLKANESERTEAEQQRASAEAQRVSAESRRSESEKARHAAETERMSNEDARKTAEAQRVNAESEYSEAAVNEAYAAWKAATANRGLARAKREVLKKIEDYDTSSAVNGFILNGETVWLDKATRVGLMNSTSITKAMGQQTTTLWLGESKMEVPCDTAIQLLSALEMYALECFNVTASHKKAVSELASIEEVEKYDITAGYPAQLKMEV